MASTAVRLHVDGHPVEVIGRRGARSPLVLVHGAGGNARTWAPVVEGLHGLEVLVVSLRGRPGSPGAPHRAVGDAAAWLAEVLHGLALEDPILVGHSYGGAVALEVAMLEGTRRAGGLVMVDSAARLRVAPAILEAVAAGEEGFPVELAFASATPRAVVDGYLDLARATPQDAALADWQACDGFDRVGRLRALPIPTLVVYGASDRLTPPKHQIAMAQALDATPIAIEGAGHMLPWEQPQAFGDALRAHLPR